jgi:type IV secretory pathway VirJ component
MINVTFDTLDDMLHFANRLAGLGQAGPGPLQENTPALTVTPAPQAPVASISQAPVQQPVTAAHVTAAPVQTAAPTQQVTNTVAPAIQQTTPVQTAAPSYTMDDLTNAAVMLMDSGRQADLLNLLAQFGVEALPALPREQYGAFATALRGLGAQI